MSPLVSVIIPCRNAAAWLADCLDSVLAQTHRELEILVIDDASDDASVAIAESYARRGIRLERMTHAGAAAARNHGLRLARGRYLQFLDADDLLHPEKIARQVACLEAAGDDQLASGEWARFTRSPEEARFDPYPLHQDMSGVEFLQFCYEDLVMMQPGAWLAPRRLLDRAGPWDERLSLNDDGEYFARVVLRSRGIRFCPGARVFYRSGQPGSLSQRRSPRHLESLYQSIDSIVRELLAVDQSPRSRAAAAFAWKWTAFELWPGAPRLSREAEARCRRLGGSPRPFPAGPAFRHLSRLLGWRLAKRLRDWHLSLPRH